MGAPPFGHLLHHHSWACSAPGHWLCFFPTRWASSHPFKSQLKLAFLVRISQGTPLKYLLPINPHDPVVLSLHSTTDIWKVLFLVFFHAFAVWRPPRTPPPESNLRGIFHGLSLVMGTQWALNKSQDFRVIRTALSRKFGSFPASHPWLKGVENCANTFIDAN